MKQQLSKTQGDALCLISGCPDGVTIGALEANGVEPEVVGELESFGLVHHRLIEMVRPKMQVVRFWATTAGRAQARRVWQ